MSEKKSQKGFTDDEKEKLNAQTSASFAPLIELRRCRRRVYWFWYHKYGFCLCQDRPALLIQSQWNIPPKLWVLYRLGSALLVAAFFMTMFILWHMSYNDLKKDAIFFVYLTHWSFLILVANFVVRALLVIFYYEWLKSTDIILEKPCIFNLSWVLNNISSVAALGVTVAYWSIVYEGQTIEVSSVISHILNSVVTLVDWMLICSPYHLGHFYHSLLYSLGYILFSLIYYYSGGLNVQGKHYIYAFLNWQKAANVAPLTLCLALGLSLTFSAFLSIFVIFRRLIAKFQMSPRRHRIPEICKQPGMMESETLAEAMENTV